MKKATDISSLYRNFYELTQSIKYYDTMLGDGMFGKAERSFKIQRTKAIKELGRVYIEIEEHREWSRKDSIYAS